MSNAQDLCVKYRRDWNRADKAISCRHLNEAERAMSERVRDSADDFLFTAKPECLAAAGALVNHGAQALSGAITLDLKHALMSIGGRLKKGKFSLADVAALRHAISACDCEPDARGAGGLDVMDADFKADVIMMWRRALGFVTRLRLV